MSSVQYLIGKSLGKYEILEHIGHGGMAEVYKGRQTQLSRMVAIKVLHPFLADEEGFVARFQREARIVATLRHPNIVQVYDFDYHDDLAIYYMVMEYLDGPTLKLRLEKGPMTPTDTVHVGIAIADALEYAHQRNMVHRDIKPANIMFLDNGEPVLTDFGIARMLALSSLTASGAMVGTPAYMAPEIGTGSAGTGSSDIYSLSVVLYQAVTGNLPFVSETPMGMVMDHINKTPPRLSLLVPDIPTTLEQVILRGMEKDPEARFRTAGDMAATLRQLLGSEWRRPLGTSLSTSSHEKVSTKTVTPIFNGVSEHQPGLHNGAKAPSQIDAEDRLVKVWSPAPILQTPATQKVTARTPESSRHRLPKLVRSMLSGFLLLLAGMLLGSGIWLSLDSSIASFAQSLRINDTAGTAGSTANIAEPTAVAAVPTKSGLASTMSLEAATSTPKPLASPTPLQMPSATPKCALRVRLDQINIEPSSHVAPASALTVILTLRNNGTCAWPAGAELRLADETSMGIPERFDIGAHQPGEIVQVFFPLNAPEELGMHHAELELQDGAGNRLGTPLEVEITVEDIPALTPTPAPLVTIQAPAPQPLSVLTPTLVTWEDQRDQDRWTGIIELASEGGSGTYYYYLGEVSATTEIADGELTVVGRRCEPVVLSLWVLSGGQAYTWKETIPYPAPERCQ